MKKNKLIVVLGMHRSGTSAITRGLGLLGVDLGSNLHPASFDNPKGFWEDRDVLAINERILEGMASSYDSLAMAWEDDTFDTEIAEFKVAAVELIKRKLGENDGIWGFKDPRTCRLLAFWQSVFTAAECDVSYVIALRNPLSVAESLFKRNEIPYEKSCILWLQHVLPSILATNGARRVIIDYDEFVANPYENLSRVATGLGLSLPHRNDPSVLDFEGEFIDPQLRHSVYTQSQLLSDTRCATQVAEIYGQLRRVALGQNSLENVELQDSLALVQAQWLALSPAWKYIDQLERQRISLWQSLAAKDAALQSIQESRNAEFENARRVREAEQQALLEKLAERDGTIARRDGVIAERDLAIAQRDGMIAQRDVMIAERDIKIAEKDGRIAARNSRLAKRDGKLSQLDLLLAEREALVAEQQAQLTQLQQIRDWLEQDNYEAKTMITSLLASKSWRLTRPLRAIRREVDHRGKGPIGLKMAEWARLAWHRLPVDYRHKNRVKGFIFMRFPALFSETQAYRGWNAMHGPDESHAIDDAKEPGAAWVAQQQRHSTSDYVPLTMLPPPLKLTVKTVAFYLPQFHAINENNEWWGEGFTEWTNVKPAQPQFTGHYQPHVPGELGFYNLLDKPVQHRQIELAKLYGIGGFCFYYYWFDGHRLLERPIEAYLADPTLDHPFCLCWANENWSRRWDGNDAQVLIAQNHSPEDDLAFAADVARYMRDSRYISIDGKPLLLVYRPSLLPSASETSQRWRDWFRSNGIGEVFLAYTQSFEVEDPRKYGFDAAIEFPPNNSAPPDITNRVEGDQSFKGVVYDWTIFPQRARRYTKPSYRLFRSVCPSWDNTARRKARGTVFYGSTPALYKEWLESAAAETLADARSDDERLVFVNAWNEWAEGAHLEPDQKYGYAWLDATRRALTGETSLQGNGRAVVVSHDAHPHGAQFLALGMVRSLVRDLKMKVEAVLLGEGRLQAEFERICTTHKLFLGNDFDERAKALAHQLALTGVSFAIVNTTVSGLFVRHLNQAGITCVTLIHEMPGVLNDNGLHAHAAAAAKYSDNLIFPASVVQAGFTDFVELDPRKAIIRSQGLWRRNPYRFDKNNIRHEVRTALGLAPSTPLVLAVGYADKRKGVDLFIQAAQCVLEKVPNAHFVWIGHWDEALRPQLEAALSVNSDAFHFLGYEPATAKYHAAADVYALTSREDPFPNVVLESFDAAVPVLAFAGTGGGAELVSQSGGQVVPRNDVVAFAEGLANLLSNPQLATRLGEEGSEIADARYAFRKYLFDLCAFAKVNLPRVSVIVPNYNYAGYIRDRLDSIINQSLAIYELIVLDDASTDNSVAVISQWMQERQIECRLVVNERNSGNVFAQWKRGIELAEGDYIWIAEADDLTDTSFLSAVIPPMVRNPSVALSYCESRQINSKGAIQTNDYQQYRADLCAEHWCADYINRGASEVETYLSVKNTIPNVSAVVFKAGTLKGIFEEHAEKILKLKRAGDWMVYTEVLRHADIAFTAQPFNEHRRHERSIIGGSDAVHLIAEIEALQSHIAAEFDVPAQRREHAMRYIESLRHQLGVKKAVRGA